MIEILFAGMIYTATLDNCYDGDSCSLRIANVPPFLETVKLRFEDFDTPEIRGKCRTEKEMAKQAKQITTNYMRTIGELSTSGKRGKYGRLLVKAPKLKKILIDAGVARPYQGGKRQGWC